MYFILLISALFLKRLNFRNCAPENTVFKNMKLHHIGSLFKLIIFYEEHRQVRNKEKETEMERDMFGIMVKSQKEKAVRRAFLVFSTEMEVLLEGLGCVNIALWLLSYRYDEQRNEDSLGCLRLCEL